MGTFDPEWGGIEPARSRAWPQFALMTAALAAAMPLRAAETAILSSPAPAATAELAYSIGIDGTRIVLGAPGESALAGAVYAFDCATLPCASPQRLVSADSASGATLGTAVSISGDTLVATAPGPEPGAAYVFIRGGSGWTQQAKLTASASASGEHFGASTSLSGDRVAIGADHADGSEGAVYVFVRSGSTWVQEARLSASDGFLRDQLGVAVSLDADTLVAGAPLKRIGGASNYANGAAYVFVRDGGGWTQQAKLTVTGANADLFGFSVAVAADRAVVGAPYAGQSQGAAYVFARSGTTWSQQGRLSGADGAVGDEFGWSVAIGGDNVVVGAPFKGQEAELACGGVYVFDATTLQQTNRGDVAAPGRDELNGWSVAASGHRFASSAPGHVIASNDHAGIAYWFDLTDSIFASMFELATACPPDDGGGGGDES